ncbi:hypothetical protein ROZALSC1DRAFT_22783, partial [Rozella allomycis CSF55]
YSSSINFNRPALSGTACRVSSVLHEEFGHLICANNLLILITSTGNSLSPLFCRLIVLSPDEFADETIELTEGIIINFFTVFTKRIVDTNILLLYPNILYNMQQYVPFVIPIVVVRELDKLKGSEKQMEARRACEFLTNHLNYVYAQKAQDTILKDFSAKVEKIPCIVDWNGDGDSLIERINYELLNQGKLEFQHTNGDVIMMDVDSAYDKLNEIVQKIEQRWPNRMQYFYKKQFGDDWTYLVDPQPPWTWKIICRLMEKHWLSVFSEYFPRHSSKIVSSLFGFSKLKDFTSSQVDDFAKIVDQVSVFLNA